MALSPMIRSTVNGTDLTRTAWILVGITTGAHMDEANNSTLYDANVAWRFFSGEDTAPDSRALRNVEAIQEIIRH